MIVPIATFLTGTLSGIRLAGGDKDMQKQALAAANKGWERPPAPVVASAPLPTQTTFKTQTPEVRVEPTLTSEITTGFGGKPAPVQPPHPEI